MKVKRESLLIFGTFYTQIGPSFKAIALNLAKPAIREELEKCFESRKYDATFQTFDWPKRSLTDSRNATPGRNEALGVALDVPRTDITAALGEDCISRLVSLIAGAMDLLYGIPVNSQVLFRRGRKRGRLRGRSGKKLWMRWRWP